MDWEKQQYDMELSCNKCGQEIQEHTDFFMLQFSGDMYVCHPQCWQEMSQRIEQHLKQRKEAA